MDNLEQTMQTLIERYYTDNDMDTPTLARFRKGALADFGTFVHTCAEDDAAPEANDNGVDDAMFDALIQSSLAPYHTLDNAGLSKLRRRVRGGFENYLTERESMLAGPESDPDSEGEA